MSCNCMLWHEYQMQIAYKPAWESETVVLFNKQKDIVSYY